MSVHGRENITIRVRHGVWIFDTARSLECGRIVFVERNKRFEICERASFQQWGPTTGNEGTEAQFTRAKRNPVGR